MMNETEHEAPRDQSPVVQMILYEHADGRTRVCRDGQAHFAAGDPLWVRCYPVEVQLPSIVAGPLDLNSPQQIFDLREDFDDWNNKEGLCLDPFARSAAWRAWLGHAARVAPRPPAADSCTCPSGDGSLRWPCPRHQADSAVDGLPKTRGQAMRDAGYTARDTRIPCDDCGAKCTPRMLPIHKCGDGLPELPEPGPFSPARRYTLGEAKEIQRQAFELGRQQIMPGVIAELSASMGWPGGISEPETKWTALLEKVAEMRMHSCRGPAPEHTGDVWIRHDDDLRYLGRVLEAGRGMTDEDRQAAMDIVHALRTTARANYGTPARPLIAPVPGNDVPSMDTARRVISEHKDTLEALHKGKEPAGANLAAMARDWQAMALREAACLTGTPEGTARLAESRRYGLAADALEAATRSETFFAPGDSGVLEFALCESVSAVLHEGQLYRFVKVGNCDKCAAMAKASQEFYGPPKFLGFNDED